MAPEQFAKSRHAASQRRVIALALMWMALVTLSVLQVGVSVKAECGCGSVEMSSEAAVAAVAPPPASAAPNPQAGLVLQMLYAECIQAAHTVQGGRLKGLSFKTRQPVLQQAAFDNSRIEAGAADADAADDALGAAAAGDPGFLSSEASCRRGIKESTAFAGKELDLQQQRR